MAAEVAPANPPGVWKPVVGWEGLYEVSDLGQVRRMPGTPRCRDGRIVKPRPNRRGVLSVSLSCDGRPVSQPVHRLVARAFLGEPEPGQEVCHGDGNPSNNRADNLRWDTRRANVLDAVAHGSHYSHGRTLTACKRGHAFDDANTHHYRGRRVCRACRRARRAGA